MRLLPLALFASMTLLLPACGEPAGNASPDRVAHADQTVQLAIAGMTCASCSVTVKVALGRLPGIASVEVDTEAGRATVRFDGSQVTAQQMATAITEAGYATTVAGDPISHTPAGG